MLDAPDLRLTHAKPLGSGALRLASFCFTNGKNYFLSQFCVPMPLATVVSIMGQSVGLVFGRSCPAQMIESDASKVPVAARVRRFMGRAWRWWPFKNEKRAVNQPALVNAATAKRSVSFFHGAKRPDETLIPAIGSDGLFEITDRFAVLGAAVWLEYWLFGHDGLLHKLLGQGRAAGSRLGASVLYSTGEPLWHQLME
jgi:hypothetical protein